MKSRFLFVFGLLMVVMITALNATAQTAFPTKLPARRLFRKLATSNSATLPKLKSSIVQPRISEDHGNVSVLHDDGTLVVPQNLFDLVNASLVFTPQGNGYTVQTAASTFVNASNNAKVLQLAGNSTQLNLPFTFKFYGKSYTSVFVNSGGNLTFGAVDNNDFYYGLNAIITGPPRIAALFDYLVDQYGGGFGQIAYETFSDHINFYWYQVEDINQNISTFEIILQNNGTIQFNYGAMSATTAAAIGLSPGGASSIQVVDLSQQSAPFTFTGAIGETYSPFLDLDLGAVSQTFYQSHPDNYDGLMVFADFDGLNGAYAQPVRNATQGVNSLFDGGTFFGSKSRLFVTGNLGSVSQYPADPTATFVDSHTTLTMVGQMFGHAWMSYVDTNPSLLLGLQDLWSFVMDGQGSVMEGNTLQDLGNGQFKTTNPTYHYSPLDEYLMGLRPPANVPNWFVVLNSRLISAPSDFSCSTFGPACFAHDGVQFAGTRQNISLQNVIANVGARVPSSATSQKNFTVGFIVVTAQGQAVNPQNLAQVDNIRQQWSPWFVSATDSLGGMSTTLQALAPTISSVTPNQGLAIGGSLITITGTNFQATASVTVGGSAAPVVSATATTLQVIVPPGSGTATITVTNPDGQSANSSYTYSSAPLSQLQLALPANGSIHTETGGSSSTVQVGYGVISAATGVALIRSFSNGSLVSEAAVSPTPAANQWVMYAEVGSGGVSTGVAIANPGQSPANLTLTLSNGAQTTLQLAAGAQQARFVNELFTNLPSFLGTLTVQSNVPVSIVALRGTQNANGQFIISTIPLSSGSSATGTFAGFPITADGGGYNTDIILVNSGTSTSSGLVGFSFNVQTDMGTNTQFPFTIPAGGMWRIRTAGASSAVVSGYASMQVSGGPVPNATGIIRLTSGANLISETAVPAQNMISQAMMFGSLEANLRTGIALLNPQSQPVLVTLTPINGAGQPVATPATLTVAPFQNVSKFLDEMIPSLPVGFEGSVLVRSSAAIFAISLRGTTTINGFLMSTTPVLDLNQTYSGTFYFPQVVDGGGFTTEFLALNAATPNLQLQFFDTTGKALSLSLK